MSWDGIELSRTKAGVGILRGGAGMELTLEEICWIVRNLPIILKVGDGESMRMPERKPKGKASRGKR